MNKEIITNKELIVSSNSFSDGGEIPKKYTCDGENISPHLKWENAPAETKAFALKVDDPDAPVGTFIHWKIANIPASKTELSEGESAGIELTTSFGANGYGGPCSPSGMHRYYFRVYALDAELESATPENFDSLVLEHAVASGKVMGTYQRK